jgi:hypothetical protein
MANTYGLTENNSGMSRPPKVPIKDGGDLSLLEQIPALSKEDIGIRQVEAILSFKNEELKFLEGDQYSFFILGNYDEIPRRRLNFICQRLNQKPNTTAQTLIKLCNFDELPDIKDKHVKNLPQTHCQFHLVARNIDAIILVAEDQNAGSSVELGELVPSSGQQPGEHPYFQDTYVLPRNYSPLTEDDIHNKHSVDVDNPYSRPQRDKFDIFDVHGRCYRWTERVDLIDITEGIHKKVTNR